VKPLHSETCRTHTVDEIRYGIASWDDGSKTMHSVKYTWFDKRGRACRGGEVPIDALPQMLEVAVREGNLQLQP